MDVRKLTGKKRNGGNGIMNYTNWFKDILRDPETGERLNPTGNGFVRKDGDAEYSINDGILSRVFPPDLSGENAKMNQLYKYLAPFYQLSENVFGRAIFGLDMVKGRAEIVSLLGLPPGIKLLEVSPGPGVFQRLLRDRVGAAGEIVALDLSLPMLKQCQLKNQDLRIELVHGNAEYLPFASETFDAVFHFGGVNLFNEPEKAVCEFVRVAKKGGMVAWGDEGFASNFPDDFRKRILMKINPGFLKPRPAIAEGLVNVKEYEVYDGMGYLVVGEKKR
jgi:ubiquinone/menaquinone biosynthesis C-methylase UbiE